MIISVLITSYNRVHTTIAALRALYLVELPPEITVNVVLVDDGSSDGTADRVSIEYPEVAVIRATGDLFWTRGMAVAFRHAFEKDPDYMVWLNDDTILAPNSLTHVLGVHSRFVSTTNRDAIVVGATIDKQTDLVSYAGLGSRSRLRKFSYERRIAHDSPLECDAMNGNFVLVPRAIYKAVGNLDPVYQHSLGDVDYAIRARELGFAVLAAPGVVGFCSRNQIDPGLRQSLPFRRRWAAFTSRKGLPIRSWLHFTRRHGGGLWVIFFIFPYIKFVLRHAVYRLGVIAGVSQPNPSN